MTRADHGGVGIHYEAHGPEDGPAVLLLHGFPDTGRVWRHQVPALAGAGFRVLVPDLRGYGRSDKPAEVDAYDVLLLAGDVLAVLDDAGVRRAAAVGHDWGAVVAWVLASMASDRIERMMTLSVGHPAALRAAGLEQRQKSWYMLLFQFEGIAEQWLRDDDWANFRQWSRHPDKDAVIADLEANGSVTPALNWYRANLPPRVWIEPPIELPPVQVPVTGVWSSGDSSLTEEQMKASAAYCTAGFTYVRLDGTGHWIQLDAPAELNRLLLDFLPRPLLAASAEGKWK